MKKNDISTAWAAYRRARGLGSVASVREEVLELEDVGSELALDAELAPEAEEPPAAQPRSSLVADIVKRRMNENR